MSRTLLLFDSTRWRDAWMAFAHRGLGLIGDAAPSEPVRAGLPVEWLREDLFDHAEFRALSPAQQASVARLATTDPFLSLVPPGLWRASGLQAPWEALELRAPVIQVKRLPSGTRLSYGHAYTMVADATIATVAIGYGDGYRRTLSSRGWMLVDGVPAPVAGRVCMDQSLLDLATHPAARRVVTGAIVVAAGGPLVPSRGARNCDFGTLADLADIPVFELLSGLGVRVERLLHGQSALEPISRLRYG